MTYDIIILWNKKWIDYINTFKDFPPPRLLLSLYVIAIILFQISVDISKKPFLLPIKD